MKSIKKEIIRSITILPAVILFSLFLAIDIVLDDWLDERFDESLRTKSNYLKELVQVNKEGVYFDFTGEFMPEFERQSNAQYFQLWVDSKPFERSDSLQSFPNVQLSKQILKINRSKIIDVILPDGRAGRVIMHYFHPQVASRLRSTVPPYQHTVFFTVAISNENFSNALIAMDIILWLLFFGFIIAIRYLVTFQIDKGLKPLSLLNKEIAKLKVDKSTSSLNRLSDEYIEIAPIRAELFRFIEFSQQTLKEEQRLSADIAHELKTPISEVISLSEMHIQYPNDLRISETYAQDMLSIAQRMKHIVNNLMMLNQSDEYLLKQQNENVELISAINDLLETIQTTHVDLIKRIKINNSLLKKTLNLDIISFNLIVTNLINNALFHSPAHSEIHLKIENGEKGYPQISIRNHLDSPISDGQLQHIFKPLYQIDKARSENSHYGLGLAIVDKLCVINHYTIDVTQSSEGMITFTLSFNKY